MSAVSITINREPVSRGSYDGASVEAKIQSEVFERLIDLDAHKHDLSAQLCRRLAVLYDLSPKAYRMVLRLGSGDLSVMTESYEHLTNERGLIKSDITPDKRMKDLPSNGAPTKQSIHYEIEANIRKIQFTFPELAVALHQYRDHATRHHRVQSDGESAKDAGAGAGT